MSHGIKTFSLCQYGERWIIFVIKSVVCLYNIRNMKI